MIKLLVDSSADYTKEEINNQNLLLAPLNIHIQGQDYLDGVNLFPDEFYTLLTTNEEFPKTSQPSPQEFLDIFEKVKESKDELICILLSSALSGTYQSAVLAKNMVDYDGIYLVDTLSVTAGIRLMVDKAQDLICKNKSAEEICSYLDSMKSRVKILAAVDTLEYLCKGGRVSKTAATLGNMAKLKPIVSVSLDGKVDLVAKRLGMNKSISYIIDSFMEQKLNATSSIYTIYSYGMENVEKLEKKLETKGYQIDQRLQIGPAIGTHVGPGAFGVCFVIEE